MTARPPARVHHRSECCKRYVAAKVRSLAALSFMRTPPQDWTDGQRAAYEAWYPGDLAVAAEVLADPRFPLTH